MAVTRVWDPTFGWIVVPVKRWNGTAWVADARPKAWNVVSSSWIPMNGCAVRIVGYGQISAIGLVPSGAQVNIHGTGTLNADGTGTAVDPCIASGLYMEDNSATIRMEDDSDCILVEA